MKYKAKIVIIENSFHKEIGNTKELQEEANLKVIFQDIVA